MCKFGEPHYQPPRHSQALMTKSGQLHFRVDSHCDNNYVVLLFLSFHPKSTKIARENTDPLNVIGRTSASTPPVMDD